MQYGDMLYLHYDPSLICGPFTDSLLKNEICTEMKVNIKQYFDDVTATETWLYILGKY